MTNVLRVNFYFTVLFIFISNNKIFCPTPIFSLYLSILPVSVWRWVQKVLRRCISMKVLLLNKKWWRVDVLFLLLFNFHRTFPRLQRCSKKRPTPLLNWYLSDFSNQPSMVPLRQGPKWGKLETVHSSFYLQLVRVLFRGVTGPSTNTGLSTSPLPSLLNVS